MGFYVKAHVNVTCNSNDSMLGGPQILPAVAIGPALLAICKILDLSRNEFSGSLPLSVNLPSIEFLDISDNNFRGPIASGFCINSTGIKVLNLGVNYFDGEIPPEFGTCSSLEQLSLNENDVSGIIPEYLYSLPKLSHLISGNIPDYFHRFPNLTYFAAYLNYLYGEMPSSLLNSPSISSLILRNNSLFGSIDLNCSAMRNLELLDLSHNMFLGAIPDNLPSCMALKFIYFDGNNLTGQIPESFEKFRSLSLLSLMRCNLKNLSVSLDVLQHCTNLTTLVLTSNFHNEEMPSIANLHFKVLENLFLRNSNLSGRIPVWLSGSTKLKILDLSCNQLKGQIPPYLGDLSSLLYLNLSNNFLSAGIPKSLTRLPCLQILDISLCVPMDMPAFKRRGMSGRLVPQSYGIEPPRTLDLSNNSLAGPIWPEFGDLTNLQVLNLNYNNLSGYIPSNLAGLSSIQTLDFSHNNLSGRIPHSLVRLNFLSEFSVAYNSLTGTIPSGGQFSTFSDSSFEGNPGLCGELVLKCDKHQDLLQTPEPENKEHPILGLPERIGFGIGFLLTFIVLLVVPAVRDFQN
uniref:phytosulfokine receptor 1-like n=1 Tax=Erigeron canadensis TaxID=72917 RepID=UPI001CB93152|nr:phytosulfokine receptor 1-like [Erigeron canadensis]